jgi:hypothetical protein
MGTPSLGDCCLSALNGLLAAKPHVTSKLYETAIETGSEMHRRLQLREHPLPNPQDGVVRLENETLSLPNGFQKKLTGSIKMSDLVAVNSPLQWINPPPWMLGKLVHCFVAVAEITHE